MKQAKTVALIIGVIAFIFIAVSGVRSLHSWWIGGRIDVEDQLRIFERLYLGTKGYSERYHEMPMSMSVLMHDSRQGLAWVVWTNDIWGRPIRFTVGKDEVTFTSLGKDAVPGGERENGDWVLELAANRISETNEQRSVLIRRLSVPVAITKAMEPAFESLNSEFQAGLAWPIGDDRVAPRK